MSGGCEWNPDEDRPAWNTDEHHCTVQAEVLVGADGQWRLCSPCSRLPKFRAFRTRRPLRDRTSDREEKDVETEG